MKRGVGYINPHAKSGYTSISVTRDTRNLLETLRRELAFGYGGFDELLYGLAEKTLGDLRSIESAGSAKSYGSSRSEDSIETPIADSIDHRTQIGRSAERG